MKFVFTTVLHLPTEDRSAVRSSERHLSQKKKWYQKEDCQASVSLPGGDFRGNWPAWGHPGAQGHKTGHRTTEVFFQSSVRVLWQSLPFDSFSSCSKTILEHPLIITSAWPHSSGLQLLWWPTWFTGWFGLEKKNSKLIPFHPLPWDTSPYPRLLQTPHSFCIKMEYFPLLVKMGW